MRLVSLLFLVVTVAAMLGAAYLGPPYWYYALYAIPLFTTLLGASLAANLLELVLGPRLRTVAPLLGLALAFFAAMYALFERAPGTFPTQPLMLQELGDKALSVVALGATIAGLGLSVYGLRSPSRASQAASLAGVISTASVLGTIPRALGIPYLSPWLLGALAIGAGGLVLTTGRKPSMDKSGQSG